ncbi:unnamed protein product [Vitrella brassicaformis CCMP3155]|uniref:Uncharacterized protein n=1 Tax=Vitrella brassicaformis (strain CCMP3155) TaxID=1169540 RepID=A0A0G4EEE4_VITBC|nr:unnamed protein product [Vitrella brassicaformis CCMP3155]|eukprot:CEL93932.1 unnamed protein product [Vitrella brassicaformis CCMP3155]
MSRWPESLVRWRQICFSLCEVRARPKRTGHKRVVEEVVGLSLCVHTEPHSWPHDKQQLSSSRRSPRSPRWTSTPCSNSRAAMSLTMRTMKRAV